VTDSKSTSLPKSDSCKDEDSPEIGDQTVYRGDMTVMRDELSVTSTTAGQESWRSELPSNAQPGEADAPKVLKQRFVLEERIGSGGMGSVFRAKDLRKVEARDNQPYVAIKILNNDFRHHPEAFIALEREASKSQSLRHTNIVSIFDFDKDGDVPFITMELLQGDELADLLKNFPNGLPAELAWKVIKGMVLGLGHAHDEGVVHADFKPSNVYVTERATKILDFGIARAMRLNQGGEDTDFDPSRLAALTPVYASREMLNGDNPEVRDDLFSLGIVIYMVLTGHHPYGRVPAHEAAREGLKPERIKHLSRRRWQVLERCLRLSRQERPADAQEIYTRLFGKPAWKSWSMAATAALVTASLGLYAMQDTASLNEVKEEVRQETLVDAQVERIAQLVSDPQFDQNWQRLLFSEIQTLRTLTTAGSVKRLVDNRVEEIYADHISSLEQFDMAFEQFQAGLKFGSMPVAREALHERLLVKTDSLINAPLDAQWLTDAEQTLSYARKYFTGSTQLLAVRAELVAYVNQEVERLVASGQTLLAEQAWNTFAAEMFDEERNELVVKELQQAIALADSRRNQLSAQRVAKSLSQDMDGLMNVSCLRLDISLIKGRLVQIGQQFPGQLSGLGKQIGTRIDECVARLGAIDPDRAISLRNEAIQKLRKFVQVDAKGIDPCSLHYLEGNGAQTGRSGSCADEVNGSVHGPRLVVVPAGETLPKFAISKYEISRRELNEFCAENSLCSVAPKDTLPATGLPVDVIEAYAKWLSVQTGYHYRLPTIDEWQQVARGEPDPNRNCRVNVGGVKRGDELLASRSGSANSLGLVNVLGNVQEIVKFNGDYLALGGTYSDPIDTCLAETTRRIQTQSDERTGFRLVREVS